MKKASPRNPRPRPAASEHPPAVLAIPTPRERKSPQLQTATLLWIVIGIIAAARMAQFWGLHYGNTDDITVDYFAMKSGVLRAAMEYAVQQARVFQIFGISLYALTMSLSGSGWYDLVNLSAFVAGSVLPIAAFHRFLTTPVLQLYVVAYFSTLPLLFTYCPPYSYATYMFVPLAFCGTAMLLFERWRDARPTSRRTILLALACGSLFLALFSYEPLAILSVTLLAANFWLSAPHGTRLSLLKRRDVVAAIGICVFYLMLYAAWRLRFPPSYSGVQPALNISLPQMIRVVGTLSLTSSIFARYVVPQVLFYEDYGNGHVFDQPLYPPSAGHLFSHATLWQVLIAALTIAAAYKLVTSISSRRPLVRVLQLATLAAVLLFLPNALYAFIPKISTLVLTDQLVTYTGTAFAHIGFSLLLVALVVIAAARSNPAVRLSLAVLIACVMGWASLASSGFNRTSQVYAREQGAKWTVIHNLAACKDHIPGQYLSRVVAPRLWNFSTGAMAWMQGDQNRLYWDVLASKRYKLQAHFYMRPQNASAPLTVLDYHLAQNGQLSGIVIGAAPDGAHFQDVFIIKDSSTIQPAEILTRNSTWMYQSPENTSSCSDGLQIVRFAGQDLNLGTVQVYDLPDTYIHQ